MEGKEGEEEKEGRVRQEGAMQAQRESSVEVKVNSKEFPRTIDVKRGLGE